MVKTIKTDKVPLPGGHFSQGKVFNNILYTAGQIGQTVSKELQDESVEAEVSQIMKNLTMVAQAAGTDLSKTLKTTIFITDLSYFKAVNNSYAQFFPDDPPSRSTVVVKDLAAGARVEIEAVIAIE